MSSFTTAELAAKLPSLGRLLSCYFHEDAFLDATSPVEAFEGTVPVDWYKRVLKTYCRQATQGQVEATVGELDSLLAMQLSEERMHALVTGPDGLGSRYWDGSAWLVSVRDFLRSELHDAA